MRFQLALNKTFCPTPPPLIYRRLKHHQKTKISKIMLSASPSSVFHTKLTISELKSKYSILAIIVVGPPVSEYSTGSQNFIPPPIRNSNFIKRESKICYPYDSIWDRLDWELALITTTLCSTANGESLKVLYTHPLSLGITL